jgi:hypothetical protein
MLDTPTLPDWLPTLVREHAFHSMRMARTGSEIATILRVATDPRMEDVWNYLRRRRRDGHVKTHEYDHAARNDRPNDANPNPQFHTRIEALQQQAMSRLFGYAVRLARRHQLHPHLAVPHPWETQAAGLRVTAGILVGESPRDREKMVRDVTCTAETLEKAAKNAVTATKQRTPAALVVLVAKELFRLFDFPRSAVNAHKAKKISAAPALAANIVGVILDKPISADAAARYLTADFTVG